MKAILIEFNRFKKKIENNKPITMGKVLMDVSQLQEPSPPEPVIQEIDGLVVNNVDLSSDYYSHHFTRISIEIDFNLSMPNLTPNKFDYLSDILDYYSQLEDRITYNDKDDPVTNLFIFDNSLNYETLGKLHKDLYHDFLTKFKIALREEILCLNKDMKRIKNQQSTKNLLNNKRPDIEWETDLNDLVELVRALKLSGAIDNRSKNLSFDQAYKIFGDLFGIKIKRPQDQMRQKSSNQDKEFFCERLNRFAQEDLKDFYKRSSK